MACVFSKKMRVFFMSVGVALAEGPAGAAVVDLNGEDLEVSSLAEYADGLTNSSDTLATLTVTLSADESYAGTISGKIKLVKRGMGDLTISSANSFTGGTEIYLGRLIAAHATALGTGEVYVESDCTKTHTYSVQANLSALTIAAASFSNDLRFSDWSAEMPYYQNSRQNNYNLQLALKNGTVKVNGKITGGSVSVFCGVNRALNSASFDSTSYAYFLGDINVTGTVYCLSADNVYYDAGLACALLSGPGNFWCRSVFLRNVAKQISKIKLGADELKTSMAYVLDGAVICGTDFSDMYHPGHNSINLTGCSQTIDRFIKDGELGSKKTAYPHRLFSNSGTPTLVMRATGDSECDWRFENDVTLCWWPTNAAYKMSCISDRISTMTGGITVSNGLFETTGTYTFSNVTAVTVCEGAAFENNSTAPGALNAVKTVRVDKGGYFKMGRADAMTVQDVTFDIDTNSTLEIPDDCEIDVNAICFAGNGIPVGTYTGRDSTAAGATPLPQLKGNGRVYVLSSPKTDVVEATWNDGAEDKAFETTGNWSNSAVAGRFGEGVINATFASAGSEAVLVGVETLNKMTFNGGVPSFTLRKGNDAASIVLGAGGLVATASAATVVTNEAPVTISGSQDWSVGQNMKLFMTGGLRQSEAKSTLLNITGGVNDNRQIRFFGQGDAGTYAGRVDIKGKVAVEGDDPFGRAVDGVDGTITLYGGNAGKLVLGKEGGPVTTITKPVKMSGSVNKTYLQLAYSKSGATRVSFLGSVDFNSNSTFDLNGFNPHVIFAGGGKMLSDVYDYAGSMTVTNTPMELSFLNTHAGSLQLCLNVSSNKMDAFKSAGDNYANDIYFGADWALYEGNTEILVRYHWGNNQYYGSTIQLNGHDQRIGTLSSMLTAPRNATKDPFTQNPVGRSQITSTEPATLYVNQAEDKAMIIPFTGKVALCKEGAAKLMISNVACTATSPLTVAGGTLELFDASWKNATSVTVTALEGDTTLKLSTKLAAADVPANKFFTKKAFGLVMTDGEGTAKLDLAEGVFEMADTFVLNGNAMSGGCTYGSSASPAVVKDDVHFTGKGVVRVAHPNGCILIIR